jgi:type II secretory pathway pseudopilin PulG
MLTTILIVVAALAFLAALTLTVAALVKRAAEHRAFRERVNLWLAERYEEDARRCRRHDLASGAARR